MKVVIGLGNGGQVAGSLLRNGYDLMVKISIGRSRSPSSTPAQGRRVTQGHGRAVRSRHHVSAVAAASAAVMEAEDGLLAGFRPGKIWAEMSTTDEAEVKRLGAKVIETGASPVDCPVSGGCHRAATGNIAIFAGCGPDVFERMLPVLTTLGRRCSHRRTRLGVGAQGADQLSRHRQPDHVRRGARHRQGCKDGSQHHLRAGAISSGNSFVHETESQVILNGSRDINFTMDLVVKDISLFRRSQTVTVPLEMNLMIRDLPGRHGAFGPAVVISIIKRLEEATGLDILAPGFPAEMVDLEPEEPATRSSPTPAERSGRPAQCSRDRSTRRPRPSTHGPRGVRGRTRRRATCLPDPEGHVDAVAPHPGRGRTV